MHLQVLFKFFAPAGWFSTADSAAKPTSRYQQHLTCAAGIDGVPGVASRTAAGEASARCRNIRARTIDCINDAVTWRTDTAIDVCITNSSSSGGSR
jgi:hypothetical protein